MKLFATLIILAVLSAVCMSVPQSPVSPPVVKPAVSSAAAKPVQNSGNVGKQTTSDDTEETAESECGPVHGKCPNDLCCSLHNECGKSTAHCNVSLGCKRKWGVCH